ncbi:TonB family protein [Neisseria weixii]|uniref:TonB family protein n=1 Tax=Neisseria weixii TaxID=1853276 RepID=A0A3N4N6S3_9NEIS|nr:TonB family protein [Neisseria weixii]ATD65386.1 energy transducer TonB [Neisseria weixii]RPD87086.1 TonB family protein [Neisseria weixii]RPD89266.1 TonB family protein [Neisseria weixii]
MNIRQTLTALVAFTLLAGSQTVMASNVAFYQKVSEATTPITGKVAMRLTIGADGDVHNVRVVRSSGSSSIDNSAVQWMEAQTMSPVLINGIAQEFSVVKEIKFSEGKNIQQASLK